LAADLYNSQPVEVSALRFEVISKLCEACLKSSVVSNHQKVVWRKYCSVFNVCTAAQQAKISPPRLVNRIALKLLPVLTHCFVKVDQVGNYIYHQVCCNRYTFLSALWKDPLFWENSFFYSVTEELVRIYAGAVD
jgi:hypothetical protein